MKILALALLLCLTACTQKATMLPNANPTNSGAPLQLIKTISLPNVEGRIDHLSIDLKNQRLFVAALGNNTVEVIDLASNKVIHSITGLSEPQGIVFVPEFNKIFVANGGDGTCQIFNGTTFQPIAQLDLSEDADNVRYDGSAKIIYVGHGNGGLSLIDASTDKILNDIKLIGHPESFQLETSDSKVFINIPAANQIAVMDAATMKVTTNWLITEGHANYPMALDENHHRLFVGSRLPAKLSIYNFQTGKLVTSLNTIGDADDIFYDAAHKLIFVIGGEGYIDIFSQQDADHYKLLTRIPTTSGARTGLSVPEQNKLYVAVPHRGSQEAEIQIYELIP